jgi:hypothetical protein
MRSVNGVARTTWITLLRGGLKWMLGKTGAVVRGATTVGTEKASPEAALQ